MHISALRQELARLRALRARNSILATEVWQRAREIDQFFAAAKEAGAKGRTLASPPSRSAARPVLGLRNSEGPRRESSGLSQPVCHPGESSGRDDPGWLIVVEDEEDDFVLLNRALGEVRLPARVEWARNGLETLTLLDQARGTAPRICIVADVQLPGMNGFDLLEAVRAKAIEVPVQFAFLTGRCDSSTQARAYACGADGFFIKPCAWSDWREVAAGICRLFQGGAGQSCPARHQHPER